MNGYGTKLTPRSLLPDRIGSSILEIAFMALENAAILKKFLTGLLCSVVLSKGKSLR